MFTFRLMPAVLVLLFLTAACAPVPAASPLPGISPAAVSPTTPDSSPGAAMPPGEPTTPAVESPPHSLQPGALLPPATEAALRDDLAARLNTPAAGIQVDSVEARTWPDAGLGCAARKGVFPPQPVPGYRVLLRYQEALYPYHTGEGEQFTFCPEPSKPLDPIR